MLRTTYEIRDAIDAAGGLVTVTKLAGRWDMSREGARLTTLADSFPQPLVIIEYGSRDMAVWLLQDVVAWEREFWTE